MIRSTPLWLSISPIATLAASPMRRPQAYQLKAGPMDWIAHRNQDGADLGMGEHDREPLLSRRANAFFWENNAQSRSSVLE
jgi:hypothetical protein